MTPRLNEISADMKVRRKHGRAKEINQAMMQGHQGFLYFLIENLVIMHLVWTLITSKVISGCMY